MRYGAASEPPGGVFTGLVCATGSTPRSQLLPHRPHSPRAPGRLAARRPGRGLGGAAAAGARPRLGPSRPGGGALSVCCRTSLHSARAPHLRALIMVLVLCRWLTTCCRASRSACSCSRCSSSRRICDGAGRAAADPSVVSDLWSVKSWWAVGGGCEEYGSTLFETAGALNALPLIRVECPFSMSFYIYSRATRRTEPPGGLDGTDEHTSRPAKTVAALLGESATGVGFSPGPAAAATSLASDGWSECRARARATIARSSAAAFRALVRAVS